MILVVEEKRRRSWVAVASLLTIAFLLSMPVLFHLDGKQHAAWQQFLGRFHPLMVHLPIGLILLVPLLEVAGRRRPALREAAGFVLTLSVYAAIATALFGYLLAYGGGVAGAVMTRHMWGGITLACLLIVAVQARARWQKQETGRGPGWHGRIYPSLLVCALLVLAWAAHQGGSLTHGGNYLTEFLPQPFRAWLGPSAASKKNAGSSFYAVHVNPILDAKCSACHGESKVSGGLRLDSYDALIRGGQHGAVIVPRQAADSMLIKRVTLPSDHKQFMPAEGRPPLKPEDIALLRAWIQAGASATDVEVAGIKLPTKTERKYPPVDDYSAFRARIAEMNARPGPKLLQVSSKPGDGLMLLTIDSAGKFDDAALAGFEPFAPYIVEANLARTGVTDRCFETLAHFKHLRSLRLDATAIAGNGLDQISSLPELTSVNLSGTKVTDAALTELRKNTSVIHLYLFNTPAQPLTSGHKTEDNHPKRTL